MLRHASSRATWIYFAVPIFLLLGIGIMAERTTASFAQSEYWVSHTHEVQSVVESLRADIFMAQDSRKGFLLTRDDSSLDGYTLAVRHIPVLAKELRHLTADNSSQQVRMDRLEPILQRKLSVLQQSIDLTRAGNTDTAKQLQLTKNNEELSSQMGTILTEMVGGGTVCLRRE